MNELIKEAAEACFPTGNAGQNMQPVSKSIYEGNVTNFLNHAKQQGYELLKVGTNEEVAYEIAKKHDILVGWAGAGIQSRQIQEIVDEAIAIGEARSRWISVEDRLPTKDDADKKGWLLGLDAVHDMAIRCHWLDIKEHPKRFTHWQPLPPTKTDTQ